MTSAWQLSIGTSTYRCLDAELRQFFASRVKAGFDPRDFVADVWVAAGRYFRGESTLRHYLFVLARAVLANHWRRAARQPVVSELGAPEEEQLAVERGLETELGALQEREALWEAVRRLEPHHRAVVELKLMGMDNYQIARELGLAYNTVRSRLSRAVGRLRAWLG